MQAEFEGGLTQYRKRSEQWTVLGLRLCGVSLGLLF